MLTRQEAESQKLIDGKDFMWMGGALYQTGDRFLKGSTNGDKEITVKEILDQTHFFDQGNYCWHIGMFDDYRCRHCPELNDPSLAPNPNKTPFEVLQANVAAGRKAFKDAELKKCGEEIYEDYHRIFFIEEMAYFLDNGYFDEKYCAFLNKEGSFLLQSMYGYHIDNPAMTINYSQEAEIFVEGYADYYGYQYNNCM